MRPREGEGNDAGASARRATYIPALRLRALTRFYDRALKATLKEERFKELLVRQARIESGHRVLDLGCGTGTLTVLVARAQPGATGVGLDGDPEALGIARTKAAQAGVAIELHEGMAFEPPFEPGSFDSDVSSLLFHHLTTEDKRRTLRASRDLLRTGGEIHVADWGRAQNFAMRIAFLSVRLLDGFATTADSARGRLPALMDEAGFTSVAETHREMTAFGTLSLYRGTA